MRQRLNPIFIILNNGTYAVEEVRMSLHPSDCYMTHVAACKPDSAVITAACLGPPNAAVLTLCAAADDPPRGVQRAQSVGLCQAGRGAVQ